MARTCVLSTIAAAVGIALLSPITSPALEKRSVAFDGDPTDDWNSRSTYHCSYYNICTGWVWCWSGFGDDARIGQVIQNCHPSPYRLLQSTHFLCTGAPSGYGFTGTISVHAVDANQCPISPPIASQPFLPGSNGTPPFHVVPWGGVSVPDSYFAIVVQLNEDLGIASPAAFGTDHPAAGPTGPIACGTCFPANRPKRSFYYGTVNSPLCPGMNYFSDGVCSAELFWDVWIDGENIWVGADESEWKSWGQIKGLYR